MSFRDMQIALDTRLNLVPNSIPIAWENTVYKPIKDQEFLRPTLLNGTSSLLDLASHQRDPGIYRVDAFYPINDGPKRLLDKLDEIYIFFKQNLSLQVNTTLVNVRAMTLTPRTINDNAWLLGSLDINFVCYENAIGGSVTPPVNSLAWITQPVSLTVGFGKGYITTNDLSRVVFALPAICQPGDYFRIAGYGLGGWEIDAPPGISIIYGDQETSNGGTLASVNPHDCIELVCVAANSKFEELSSQGNITVT